MGEIKETRGGARRGAGRPRKPESEKVTVRGVSMTPDGWQKLDKQRGVLSRGAYIERVLL